MKSLLISLFCLILLSGIWMGYNSYSNKQLHEFINSIDHSILIDVETANWSQAEDKFELLEDNWHHYKKTAHFFFSTDKLNDADYTIARAKYYIIAQDDSNATGELSCLKEQLKYLHENQQISLANIL